MRLLHQQKSGNRGLFSSENDGENVELSTKLERRPALLQKGCDGGVREKAVRK